MRSTKTILSCAVLCAAIPLTVLRAQLPGGGTDKRAASPSNAQLAGANTMAILPDFYAKAGTGTVIVHQWTADHPCTPHSHNYVQYFQLGRRFGVFPNPSVTLYRDGQSLETWTVNVPPGNTPVDVLKFSWTADHPCPDGTSTIGPNHPPNYRLVVDPANKVNEHSETNNVFEFYMDPARQYVKLP